eukprot:COSAG06_NODE_47139_length_341_cov_0.995868_1_plen_82_part_01
MPGALPLTCARRPRPNGSGQKPTKQLLSNNRYVRLFICQRPTFSSPFCFCFCSFLLSGLATYSSYSTFRSAASRSAKGIIPN